jgi:hypothetical protein
MFEIRSFWNKLRCNSVAYYNLKSSLSQAALAALADGPKPAPQAAVASFEPMAVEQWYYLNTSQDVGSLHGDSSLRFYY